MPVPVAVPLVGLAALGWWLVSGSKLSRYFAESEFTRSGEAARRGLDNTPDSAARANLARLATEVLDPLREALGKPIHVNSGYRSPAVNRAVGGVPGSAHQQGRAADVRAQGVPAAELLRLAVELDLPFDTAMLYEAKGHLHLDQRPGPASAQRRRMYWQPVEGPPEQLLAPPKRDSLV